jgi:hypothetical protein
MPRILSDEPCKVTFFDNIAGSKITLEYRLPTSEERIKYTNSQVARHGRKIESTTGETRMKYGARILTGITDGDFIKADGKSLSSSPQSKNYDAGWKEVIAKYAPDVIAMLAMQVFENALMSDEPDTKDETDNKDPS